MRRVSTVISRIKLAYANDGRFLLRPSAVVNLVVGYGVPVTAPQEQLSDFNAGLNRAVAKCLLELYRNEYPEETIETLWSASKPHELTTVNKAAILN